VRGASLKAIVALRMPAFPQVPGKDSPAPTLPTLIVRARSLCARGEALGGRLISWTGTGLALAWDADSLAAAVILAASITEEALPPECMWAAGMAEGELEPLALREPQMHLASGGALVLAALLARMAKSGEVLVDANMRAVRAGQLSLLGSRTATEAGHRVRGWRLDLQHPWKGLTEPTPGRALPARASRSSRPDRAPNASPSRRPSHKSHPDLAEHIRRLTVGAASMDTLRTLAEVRQARAKAASGSAAARCQTALALAMTLLVACRPEEALLEALDALARARESRSRRAIGACKALLAKVYAVAGAGPRATSLFEADG